MLHYAKAAGMDSMFNQLTVIWNRMHVSIRRDIPVPTEHTTLGQFLRNVDDKASIWQELADRPVPQQSYKPPPNHQ